MAGKRPLWNAQEEIESFDFAKNYNFEDKSSFFTTQGQHQLGTTTTKIGTCGQNVGNAEMEKGPILNSSDPTSRLLHCELCNVFVLMDAEAYASHTVSKLHKRNLMQMQCIEATEKVDNLSPKAIELSPADFQTSSSQEPQKPVIKGNNWFCMLCNVPCSGEASWHAHVAGKAHRKRELRQKTLTTLTTAEELQHMSAKDQRLLKATNEKSSKAEEHQRTEPPPAFICEICQIRCLDKMMYENHLQGEEHAKENEKRRQSIKARLQQAAGSLKAPSPSKLTPALPPFDAAPGQFLPQKNNSGGPSFEETCPPFFDHHNARPPFVDDHTTATFYTNVISCGGEGGHGFAGFSNRPIRDRQLLRAPLLRQEPEPVSPWHQWFDHGPPWHPDGSASNAPWNMEPSRAPRFNKRRAPWTLKKQRNRFRDK